MAKIKYVGNFIKHFNKRIEPFTNLSQKFDERIKLFLTDSSHPILKDHQLKGNKIGFRSFSITGDMRIVYYTKEGRISFVDIVTHNQVYWLRLQRQIYSGKLNLMGKRLFFA